MFTTRFVNCLEYFVYLAQQLQNNFSSINRLFVALFSSYLLIIIKNYFRSIQTSLKNKSLKMTNFKKVFILQIYWKLAEI